MKFFSLSSLIFFAPSFISYYFKVLLVCMDFNYVSFNFLLVFYLFTFPDLLSLFFSKIFPPWFVFFSSSIFYYSIFFFLYGKLMRLFFFIWCTFPLFTYNVKTDFSDCFPLKLGKHFGWIFFFLYEI